MGTASLLSYFGVSRGTLVGVLIVRESYYLGVYIGGPLFIALIFSS